MSLVRRGPLRARRGRRLLGFALLGGAAGVADRASERLALRATRLGSAGHTHGARCVAVLSHLVAHFFGSEVLSCSSVCVRAWAGYRPVK
ncbi:MAG: hypothetical protein IT371_07385 [Deltaproteobacteria bacterium]|nr:hypothetical protein [Deltaproteobacteria bacterium]